MHIISKKKIRDYSNNNAQAKFPLIDWYIKMQNANVVNLTELKKIFNSVDYVDGYTIFNVGGNNYRLITAIHYNSQRCYIREIWTHSKYSKSINQNKLQWGKL